MVTIYTTPTCGYCAMAKSYLKEKNIPFQEFDVSANQEKAQEMVRKSGQMAVPVIDAKGTIIVGFDQNRLDKALDL